MAHETKPAAGMGKPLHPPGPRANCDHPMVVQSKVEEQRMRGGSIKLYSLALARAIEKQMQRGWFGHVTEGESLQMIDQPRGQLEAYACRECGYVEWYAQDPGEIPIGDESFTELLVYPPGGYR